MVILFSDMNVITYLKYETNSFDILKSMDLPLSYTNEDDNESSISLEFILNSKT
jgi:hypothetical protein